MQPVAAQCALCARAIREGPSSARRSPGAQSALSWRAGGCSPMVSAVGLERGCGCGVWTVLGAHWSVFHVQAEGEDSLKKMQLMELAILNGTYRDANIKSRKSAAGPAGPSPLPVAGLSFRRRSPRRGETPVA